MLVPVCFAESPLETDGIFTESPLGTVGTDSRVGPGDFAYLKNMPTFVGRESGKIALTQ